MFSLKQLTQKLRLLNKASFKPNFSSKLKPVFNKRPFSSSVFSKKAHKIINKPQYTFSTTPNFACGKVTDIYAELTETLNNNIKNILEILPGKGINVSSFCLNRFSKLCYTKEPKLYDILYSNIELEVEGCNEKGALLAVAEGLSWAKQLEGKVPKVPASLLDKFAKQVLTARPLLKEKAFNNIKELLAVFPEGTSENLSKLMSAPSETYSVADCLKVLKETENYEAVKDIFQITKIDPNQNHFQVYFPENDQTLDIFTFDPHPESNLNPIITFLKENTKEINLLLLEDSALFMQPNKEYEFKEGEMLEASEKMREDTELVHVLERQELEQYVQVFMHDDNLFDYNEEEQVVYTKINLQARAPSELGTTTLHFFLNANREQEPKIALLDLTLQETIGHMAASFNLDELKGLVDLLNYCTLIEKAYYADLCQVHGCFKCRPASMNSLPLPKDMISIVAGDKELPMDYRTKFLARSAIDALDQNEDNKKSVMVTGSFHIYDILREFIQLAKKSKLGELEHFNRVERFSEQVMDFNKGSLNTAESMEKLGLLESVYQAVEVSSFDNIDPEKSSIDFQKYLAAIHEYGYQLSYEKLTQNNKEIKIRPGDCGAETLIFGPVAVEEQFIDQPDIERGKKIGEKIMGAPELSQPKVQQKEEDEGKIKFKVKTDDPKKK